MPPLIHDAAAAAALITLICHAIMDYAAMPAPDIFIIRLRYYMLRCCQLLLRVAAAYDAAAMPLIFVASHAITPLRH